MNMHDSAILEDSLPSKEKDIGSFTVPCYINNIYFEIALADLGASVSVMTYSTFTHLELRRNQVEDLGPTIKDGQVFDEPIKDIVKTRRGDNEMNNEINEYSSFCDYDKKIHIDCAYNLQFSCMIVMENIDAYRDEGMSDVIVGKPFYREICVKVRQIDRMITIYNGNDSVTYQMACSHPRFKHLTNVQCNKMRPLLKVSAQDELNGISHPSQYGEPSGQ
ncbi:reverse transcriptase domain-containing protein [Tanacetum coccineum]